VATDETRRCWPCTHLGKSVPGGRYAKALPTIWTFKVQRKQLLWLEVVSLGAGQGSGGVGRPSQTVKGIRRLRKGLWIFVPRNALETSEEFQQGNDKPGQGFQGPQITWLILKTT